MFGITKECGNFPFLELLGAKVAFLDEYRFDPDLVSWASQCLWFDGSAVPVGRPQNVPGCTGNAMYKGTAPIFITTKLSHLSSLQYSAEINPATGQPWDTDASMLLRRLKVYEFHTRVPKPAAIFPFCAACFVRLLQGQAAAWSAEAQGREAHED